MKSLQVELKRQLKTYFAPGDTFIVAVSGGVDSMTLLDLISHLTSYHFIIVSLNHSLRLESKNDVRMVRNKSKHYKLPFHSQTLKVPSTAKLERRGIEEVARDLRYQALQKFKKKYHAQAIITAHHRNDQMETILFHLIRGTDVQGLVGMQTINNHGIFRPLLTITKQDIVKYAHAHNLEWSEDTSNTDIRFSRNHIRHNLLEHFPPNLMQQLADQALKTNEAFNEFTQCWVKKNLRRTQKKAHFSRTDFLQLPLYLKFHLLLYISKYFLHLQDYSFSWLNSIYQWITASHHASNYCRNNQVLFKNIHGEIFVYQSTTKKLASRP